MVTPTKSKSNDRIIVCSPEKTQYFICFPLLDIPYEVNQETLSQCHNAIFKGEKLIDKADS
jgi:hypothetical protein